MNQKKELTDFIRSIADSLAPEILKQQFLAQKDQKKYIQ